jgi:succinyl-diaminopimelate desuccinylase
MPNVETDENNHFIQTALQTNQTYFNRSLKPGGANYYTDGSVYQSHLGVPILICGPGEPQIAHQPNEYVDIDKFIASIRYYIALAIAYLGKR